MEIFLHDHSDPNSIMDNVVRRVIQDEKGQIWISCFNRGISRYDGDSTFTNFHFAYPGIDTLHAQDPQINLSSLNSYTAVVPDATDHDVLWLGGPIGLVKFDMANEKFEWIDAPGQPMAEALPGGRIVELLSKGTQLYVGTTRNAYRLNTTDLRIQLIRSVREEHVSFRPTTKILDYQGHIYFSYFNGVLSFDPVQNQVVDRWFDNPAIDQYFGMVLHDAQDRTWVASSGTIAFYPALEYHSHNHLLPTGVRSDAEIVRVHDAETLLMLTENPDHCHWFDLEHQQWKTQRFKPVGKFTIPDTWVDAKRISGVEYLLLTAENLYRFNIQSLELREVAGDFGNPRFTELLIHPDGQIWLASINSGLFAFNMQNNEVSRYTSVFNTETQEALYTWITDLHLDDDDNIWVRLGRNFAIWQHKADSFITFHTPEAEKASFRYIRNFTQDPDGNVWMSSEDNGIGRTDKANPEQGVVEFISVAEGLISPDVLQMEFDSMGMLWILTDAGLSVYNPSTTEFTNIPWDRGLPRCRSFVISSNQDLALVIPEGGVSIFPREFLQNRLAQPRAYVSSVRAGDELVFQSGNEIQAPTTSIKTREKYLAMSFSSLGYANPKEYAYQMNGVDPDWIETDQGQSPVYSNLTPGDYEFQIKSRIKGEIWGPAQSISLEIVPRWWESAWFKGTVIWFLFIAGFLLYKWRLNTVRQKERLKAEYQSQLDQLEMQTLRSQMNPHFLFNSLNSIQHYIIQHKTKEAVTHLSKFSRLIRLILQNSRSQQISLADELEALELYLQLERVRFKDRFEYEINISESINPVDIELPPMLLQPFVENAIWHGLLHKPEKGKIWISCLEKDDMLICKVEDNGIGRAKAAELKQERPDQRESVGIDITEKRIAALNLSQANNSTIDVTDLHDQDGNPAGTRVEFRVPL